METKGLGVNLRINATMMFKYNSEIEYEEDNLANEVLSIIESSMDGDCTPVGILESTFESVDSEKVIINIKLLLETNDVDDLLLLKRQIEIFKLNEYVLTAEILEIVPEVRELTIYVDIKKSDERELTEDEILEFINKKHSHLCQDISDLISAKVIGSGKEENLCSLKIKFIVKDMMAYEIKELLDDIDSLTSYDIAWIEQEFPVYEEIDDTDEYEDVLEINKIGLGVDLKVDISKMLNINTINELGNKTGLDIIDDILNRMREVHGVLEDLILEPIDLEIESEIPNSIVIALKVLLETDNQDEIDLFRGQVESFKKCDYVEEIHTVDTIFGLRTFTILADMAEPALKELDYEETFQLVDEVYGHLFDMQDSLTYTTVLEPIEDGMNNTLKMEFIQKHTTDEEEDKLLEDINSISNTILVSNSWTSVDYLDDCCE